MADRPRKNRRRPVKDEPAKQRASAPKVDWGGWRERLAARRARLRALGSASTTRLRKPLTWLLRLSALAALAVGGLAVGRLVERHLMESPSFATKTIDVTGNERLSRAELLAVAGLEEGANVFVTDAEQVRDRLVGHPWVASAQVTRRLPDTYLIDVREHRAVAVLVLEKLYLVGGDGSVFKPLEPGDPADLPVITGVDPESFTNDRAFRTRLLVSAVALLHDYRDVGLWRREPLSEIHVEHDQSFSLYVGEASTFVRLGKRPFRKKLRRFRKVLDNLRQQEAQAEYVYLDNPRRPDRVTVRIR